MLSKTMRVLVTWAALWPAGWAVGAQPEALLLGPVGDSPGALGGAPDAAAAPHRLPPSSFWPDVTPGTLAWFAAIVILALTFRPRPLLSLHNLDAFVLALLALLLPLRDASGGPVAGGLTWQEWSYAGLTALVGYWLVRALVLLRDRRAVRSEVNVAPGAMIVLLAAGLALAVHEIATAPLSPASQDGVYGGLCVAETGRLPYGDSAGRDGRSPLLYLIHAPVVRALPPAMSAPDAEPLRPLRWSQRATWSDPGWAEWSDPAAARLVNGALFVGVVLGLYLLGRRLGAPALGPTMIAIFCVFPGVLESLARPDVLLTALLLTWSVALALVPLVGPVLSTAVLTAAGVAWPWAWLGLPVLLAWYLRRRWALLGAILGLAGAAAAGFGGLLTLVPVTMPRADAALRLAGAETRYAARVAEGATVVLDERLRTEEPSAPAALTAPLWRALLRVESVRLRDAAAQRVQLDWPNDAESGAVLMREVVPTAEAALLLDPVYRSAVSELPATRRALVALRTVLEAVWVPVRPQTPEFRPAWELWGGEPLGGRVLFWHRVAKIGAAVVAGGVMVVLLLARTVGPRHLVAGLLAVTAAALLASRGGAPSNLAVLLPFVLLVWAVHEAPAAGGPGDTARIAARLAGREPPPRISTD